MTDVVVPTRIADPSALADLVGQEIAVGEWFEISQERIARFAEATDDRQWIHLDPARAAAESPYGGTIAHGLLTLSLIVALVERAVVIDGVQMVVNYGFNRVRFPSAVPSGARVRARVSVEAGVSMGWREVVGAAGRCVSLEHFGASADYATIFREFGITAEAVALAAEGSITDARG